MTKEQPQRDEDLQSALNRHLRRLTDHVATHTGDQKGKTLKSCHTCNNITQTILNIRTLLSIRR